MGGREDHPGRAALPRRRGPRRDGPSFAQDPHPGGGGLSGPRSGSAGARHLALVGCTASGKSALSLELAGQIEDLEVVAVDSMQVYRGMDIGTAKPTAAERAAVAHHMIDLAEPGEEWSVSRWATEARAVVAGIERRGHRALLVGGTGLYLHAVVDGFDLPGRYPEVRAELDTCEDTALLHARLSRLDPVAASRMEPNNRRRVLRALEVTIGTGRPFSGYGPGVGHFEPTSWRMAGVWLPRGVVADRIEQRLREMVDAGLVAEVERLRSRDGGMAHTARQALGYREVLSHLERGVPLDEALAETARRTREFSRRQRMWWRRDPRVRWYGSAANPFAVAPLLLRDWKLP